VKCISYASRILCYMVMVSLLDRLMKIDANIKMCSLIVIFYSNTELLLIDPGVDLLVIIPCEYIKPDLLLLHESRSFMS